MLGFAVSKDEGGMFAQKRLHCLQNELSGLDRHRALDMTHDCPFQWSGNERLTLAFLAPAVARKGAERAGAGAANHIASLLRVYERMRRRDRLQVTLINRTIAVPILPLRWYH